MDVLPSVKTLQKDLENDESFVIDEWECGYVKSLAKWPISGKNKNSPLDLVHQFFEFYSTFDYKTSYISPYNGEPTNKLRFSRENSPADVNMTDAENDCTRFMKGHFCVQDPFERDLNITKGYLEKALETWKKCCFETSKVTKTLISKSGKEDEGQNKGILKIFEIKLPTHAEIKEAMKKPKRGFKVDENNYRFEFRRETDPANNEQQLPIDDFTEIIQNNMKWILKDVFLTEIVEMPETITNPCHKCPFYMTSEEKPKQENEASQSLLAGLKKDNSSNSKWKVKTRI